MMAKESKKTTKKTNSKVLDAIACWRLIYDEKRNMYIKVVYAPSEVVEDEIPHATNDD